MYVNLHMNISLLINKMEKMWVISPKLVLWNETHVNLDLPSDLNGNVVTTFTQQWIFKSGIDKSKAYLWTNMNPTSQEKHTYFSFVLIT